jgi:hypothetical protein
MYENNDYNDSYYFVEPIIENNNQTEREVIHLIMGNDENVEVTEKVRNFFNKNAFEYIKKHITTGNEKKKIDVIGTLKEELLTELSLKSKESIQYKNKNHYGRIVLRDDSNINDNKNIIKNKDLYFNSPEYSYYLNEDKTKLYIIIELVGKEFKIDVNISLYRGKYIFIIEGFQQYGSERKNQFLIRFELIKKKFNIQIKPKTKKSWFDKGIYIIEYDIEKIYQNQNFSENNQK